LADGASLWAGGYFDEAGAKPNYSLARWVRLAPGDVAEPGHLAGPGDQRPSGTRLLACYPQPVMGGATLRYVLERPGPVRLTISDAQGRLVTDLGVTFEAGGEHARAWTGLDRAGRPLPAGVYFVRLEAEGKQTTTRVTLIR